MESLVVVTNGNRNAQIILEKVMSSCDVAGVIVVTGDYSSKTGLHSLYNVGKRTTPPYVVAKVLGMLVDWRSRSWRRDVRTQVPLMSVASVNDPRVKTFVERHQADLLVSVSCPQRIPAHLISEFRRGGINIHASLLPKFAGLAPYYWVLVHGSTTAGITAHRLVDRFDDGQILSRAEIEIVSDETAFGLFERLSRLGSAVLFEAVQLALEDAPGHAQDRAARTYNSHPTWNSYICLRRNGHRIVSPHQLLRLALVGSYTPESPAKHRKYKYSEAS